jgi:hypothetical protein
LGALAHYLGDAQGHPLGVNRAVALAFPKLRARHGDSVTYVQSSKAHLRIEFGFDVVQVVRGLYPSEAYREFIGFEVPLPLLDRAVRRTYGIELSAFLPRPERAVRSLRRFAASRLPKATRVAWAYKRDEIQKLLPSARNEWARSCCACCRRWASSAFWFPSLPRPRASASTKRASMPSSNPIGPPCARTLPHSPR